MNCASFRNGSYATIFHIQMLIFINEMHFWEFVCQRAVNGVRRSDFPLTIFKNYIRMAFDCLGNFVCQNLLAC